MGTKTIEFLPLDEMRIVKQIIIVENYKSDTDSVIGYILYERPLSQEYKFKLIPERERDFSYYLNYPKQEYFPSDNIDDILLQAVRNSHPKSEVRNHSLVCNVEIDRINTLKNMRVESGNIRITPDFSGVDIYSLAGRNFNFAEQEINIYASLPIENPNDKCFFGYYDITDTEIVNKIMNVKFL